MKLNLDIVTTDPRNDIPGYTAISKYNPIGWWRVTTEGDCEGRTTNDLGVFYGHVAEIAFAKRKHGGYSLNFIPLFDRSPPNTTQVYTVTKGVKETAISVHIHFDCKMTDACKPSPKAVAAWLDADGITVGESNYYDSVKLTMKV
jgi:hypothetical protein